MLITEILKMDYCTLSIPTWILIDLFPFVIQNLSHMQLIRFGNPSTRTCKLPLVSGCLRYVYPIAQEIEIIVLCFAFLG